jgi:hypothetical protein
MSNSRFRRPDEMSPERDTKVPVSSRIQASTREFLEKESKASGLSLALLLGNIIEDYAEWLRGQRKPESRRK